MESKIDIPETIATINNFSEVIGRVRVTAEQRSKILTAYLKLGRVIKKKGWDKKVIDSTHPIYLETNFSQKDHAKKYGAMWDKIRKQWYFPLPLEDYENKDTSHFPDELLQYCRKITVMTIGEIEEIIKDTGATSNGRKIAEKILEENGVVLSNNYLVWEKQIPKIPGLFDNLKKQIKNKLKKEAKQQNKLEKLRPIYSEIIFTDEIVQATEINAEKYLKDELVQLTDQGTEDGDHLALSVTCEARQVLINSVVGNKSRKIVIKDIPEYFWGEGVVTERYLPMLALVIRNIVRKIKHSGMNFKAPLPTFNISTYKPIVTARPTSKLYPRIPGKD